MASQASGQEKTEPGAMPLEQTREAWGCAESLWGLALGRSRDVDEGTPVNLHRAELPQRLPGLQGARGIS